MPSSSQYAVYDQNNGETERTVISAPRESNCKICRNILLYLFSYSLVSYASACMGYILCVTKNCNINESHNINGTIVCMDNNNVLTKLYLTEGIALATLLSLCVCKFCYILRR